jgi:glycopeptide antibiotics resistance protein
VGLVLSSLLVLVADFPWGDLQNHSDWGRVGWIPFVSPPYRLRDIVLNAILCAPLGGFAGRMFRWPLSSAFLLALVLSLTGEWTQIYSHTRFPSATDVACNVAGAVIAAAFTRRLRPVPNRLDGL